VVVEGGYDLAIDFMRLSGDDGVNFMLPVGTSQCNLQLSGWHGDVGGISLIDGRNSDNNSTTKRPCRLENNKKHSILIKVRVEGDSAAIDAILDNSLKMHWAGKQASLRVEDALTVPDPRRPAIGATQDRMAYTSIRIRPAGKISLLSSASKE
jgi:hypothetical protein